MGEDQIEPLELREPLEIKPFEIKDDHDNTFSFSGATISSEVHPVVSCGNKVTDMMNAVAPHTLLRLVDYHALNYVAYAVIRGDVLEGIDETTQKNAVTVLQNNLLWAYANRTPTTQGFLSGVGERLGDIFSLENAVEGEETVEVDWFVNPIPREGAYGFEGRTERVKIPKYQGTVVPTSDGLYHPETGLPFAVERVENTKALAYAQGMWDELEKEIVRIRDEKAAEIDTGGRALESIPLVILMKMSSFNPFPDIDYSSALELLMKCGTLAQSHDFGKNEKLERSDQYISLMRSLDINMDQRANPNCIAWHDASFGDCGMSPRSVQYH